MIFDYNLKLLAFDTSTDACSVALYINGKILERFEVAPQKHAQLLLPMIDELLKEGGVELKELDALAIGRGPGSFTGLRIAIAVAQGMGFGSKKPIVPISTLQALAQETYNAPDHHHADKNILAWLDARMQEIYWGLFSLDEQGIMQPVSVERVEDPNAIILPAGDWVRVTGFPKASIIAKLACHEFLQGNALEARDLRAVYIRNKVVHNQD